MGIRYAGCSHFGITARSDSGFRTSVASRKALDLCSLRRAHPVNPNPKLAILLRTPLTLCPQIRLGSTGVIKAEIPKPCNYEAAMA